MNAIQTTTPDPSLLPSTFDASIVAPRPRRTLFQISEDMLALYDLLEEVGGDVSEEEAAAAIEIWFAELAADQSTKVDGYCALIKMMEAQADARKAEAARLAALAQADANKATNLKVRLKQYMEETGNTKIETPRFKVAVQANGGKAPLIIGEDYQQADFLPAEFKRVRYEVNTDALRAAIEDPEAFRESLRLDPDYIQMLIRDARVIASIGERGTHLRIR